MAIAKNSKVCNSNNGFVPLWKALDGERKYMLSMHTMTLGCSFTEIIVNESVPVNVKVWLAVFESSNGERHTIEVTPGTQVLTTFGWVAVELLDWTSVIIDYIGCKAKLVSLTQVPPAEGEYISIVTAFNRNLIVDGIPVRENSTVKGNGAE